MSHYVRGFFVLGILDRGLWCRVTRSLVIVVVMFVDTSIRR